MAAKPLSREEAQRALDLLAKHDGNVQAAARAAGLPHETFRNRVHRAHVVLKQQEQSGVERTAFRLNKENAELRRELKKQRGQELDEEEARRILGTFASTPATPPQWLYVSPAKRKGATTAEVPVVMLCDWHMGETIKKDQVLANEYNKRIAYERAHRTVDGACSLADEYGPGNYPGLCLGLLGDFISGWLHAAQVSTDWAPPLVCAFEARDLLVASINQLLEQFKNLYIFCAAGNHGRNTPKPEYSDYVFKNYDWMIYQMLIRHYQGNKHVIIDCRPSNEVHFRIWRTRFLACHGDMLGVRGGDGIIGAIGPIMRGEIKTRGVAMSIVSDYDHLLMGHWHQPLWLPRAFVSNTMKGYCPYAKNALKAPPTPPSQHMFFVHPDIGVTSRWEVFADVKKMYGEAPQWVTILGDDDWKPTKDFATTA